MEDTSIGNDGTQIDSNQSTQSGGTEQTTTQAPAPIELDENALIRIKGSDKPVKFGEHVRGFQSQFTKASQRAAQLERQLQERQTRLEQLERERQAAQVNQRGGQEGSIYDSLKELPYLDGPTAVKVVQGIAQQIQQRDQVLIATLNQLKSLQGIVNELNSSHVNSSFEGKIDKWFQENQWDPSFKQLAKKIYLAYEGDDLDEQFPSIFSAELEGIEKAIEARRAAQVQKARQNRFVPGKGGNTGPSKPLEFKGNEDPRTVAEQLWEQFQTSGT